MTTIDGSQSTASGIEIPRISLLFVLLLATPPILVGLAYSEFLGHRSDYIGHFLAGFGGTLGATTLMLLAIPYARFANWAFPFTLAMVLACITLGAILEETLYHIAKWDEVDFCNQSLGAVLAGLAALSVAGTLRKNLTAAALTACWAGVVLLGGYYFAFR